MWLWLSACGSGFRCAQCACKGDGVWGVEGLLGYAIRVADMMPCDPSGSGVELALVLKYLAWFRVWACLLHGGLDRMVMQTHRCTMVVVVCGGVVRQAA
jgi:hypothetical protein